MNMLSQQTMMSGDGVVTQTPICLALLRVPPNLFAGFEEDNGPRFVRAQTARYSKCLPLFCPII